ncbi:unnamed protein product [Bemisia tabaci]|uniref:Uncharacterized protein n=1 Tax=Bemisia tabaci TaxID=7038 RepID=A0A9P0A9T3_BEMTA|nr:unnamed protein product [Bemisia tabaci]
MRILDECTGDIMVNRNSGVISDVRCEFVCRTSDKKFSKNSNGLPVPKLRSVPKRPSMLRSRSVCSGAQVKNLSDNVDSHSDSSEEFQYGPGIVNKLKTKYLSMTLRENQKYGVRPSLNNLRRATSLENMLDEEAPPPKTVNNLKCFNKYSKSSNPSSKNCYKSTANSMTRNDSLKRAQSMETLVHADTNGSEMRDIKTTPLLNDKCHELNGTKDLVILEKVPQIENGIDNPPLEKTELPPPDVVKQTVKLFEPTSTDKKPAKLKINKVAKPSEVVQSNSVSSPAAISKQIMKGEKPVPLSKPNLSPKPSPEKLHQNQLRKFTPPPKITNSNHVNRSNIHTSTLKFIPTNPMVSKPVLKSPVNIPEINDETVTVKPSESVSSKCTDDDDESSTDESHERLSPDKVVSKDALENIRKGGTSLCFKFKENDKDSNNSPKSYLPASPSEPQKEVPTVIVSPQPTSPVSPPKIQNDVSPESKVSPVNSTPVTHMKQVGVIRPIVSSRQINLPNNMKQNHLTSQEKEKNLINEVKSIEQPVSKVVVAFKTLPSRVSNTVPVEISAHPRGCNSVSSDPSENELKSGGLWEKKPWHHQQNTVVFNFSDRKDVPDYIENDGLIMRSNRDRPVSRRGPRSDRQACTPRPSGTGFDLQLQDVQFISDATDDLDEREDFLPTFIWRWRPAHTVQLRQSFQTHVSSRPLCVKVFELAEKSLSSRVSFFWRNGNRIFLAVEIAVSCVSIVTESVKRDPISRKKIVETLNFARARIPLESTGSGGKPPAAPLAPSFEWGRTHARIARTQRRARATDAPMKLAVTPLHAAPATTRRHILNTSDALLCCQIVRVYLKRTELEFLYTEKLRQRESISDWLPYFRERSPYLRSRLCSHLIFKPPIKLCLCHF